MPESAGNNTTEPASEEPFSGNSTVPEKVEEDDHSASNITYTETKSEEPSSGSDSLPENTDNSKIHTSTSGKEVSVCRISDIPISKLYNGVTIEPGCIVMVDADITLKQMDSQNNYASVVTICSTRRADVIILDASKLESFELMSDKKSLISTLGFGDDSQLTVFKGDNCEGQVFKRFLGTPATSNRSTQLYSLSEKNYMYDGSSLEGNIRSVKMKTSTETLSDCSKTVSGSDMKLYQQSMKVLHSEQLQPLSSRQKFLKMRAQNK